ncbi:MAG: T9SS type A sorting domain-containing protein [Bacteroidetes bacterium]|nr:T9SS type A sorting domain-containing protein [Bacteroidota bacterium]
MKKPILLVVPILLATQSFAQNPYSKYFSGDFHRKRSATVNDILKAQLHTAQNKTTAGYQRVAGTSFYVNNSSGTIISDSVVYMYSADRGSMFDYNDMSFYNQNVLSDTMVRRGDNGSSGLQLSATASSIYTTGNLLDVATEYAGTQNNPSQKTIYKRDGSGNITTEYSLNWNSAQKKWDSSSRIVRTFNSSNKVAMMIGYTYNLGTWVQDNKADYTYDGAGNMITVVYYNWSGGSWSPDSRQTNSYTTSNKISTNLSEYYNGSSWEADTRDSFGYTGSADFYTYDESWVWNSDSVRWDKDALETKTLGSNNLPDVVTYYSIDSVTNNWAPDFQNEWHYNTYNNPISADGSIFFMGTPFNITTFNCYYEAYFDLGVKDAQVSNNMVLYPNPASDVVTLSLEKNTGNKFSVVFINAVGQTVIKQDVASGSANIQISQLPQGLYKVMVKNENNSIVGVTSFIKQ